MSFSYVLYSALTAWPRFGASCEVGKRDQHIAICFCLNGMFHRLFFYPTATFGRFPFQHLVMVPYKCKKRNMPNASLKTRRTDKIRVCSEAGPMAISQGNSDMEVHPRAIPSVMPSDGEGSAERLPPFCRGECNDT